VGRPRKTAINKARTYADRALKLDPDHPDACTTASLVSLLQMPSYLRGERSSWRRAGPMRQALLVSFLRRPGFSEEAVALSETAIHLSPNYPGYYLGHLGNACRLSGRTREAIAAYQAMTPGTPDAIHPSFMVM
jgi:adenylate cyclase